MCRLPAILKRREERYFTPGQGEEKEIMEKLQSPSVQAPDAHDTGVLHNEANSRTRSLSLPEPDEPVRGQQPAALAVSPNRPVLENISNSPRANRVASKIDLPPPATAVAISKAVSRPETNEQESYLPTPQTVEKNTASSAPPDSSASTINLLATSRMSAASAPKTSYRPLVPKGRVDSQTEPSSSTAAMPSQGKELQSSIVCIFATKCRPGCADLLFSFIGNRPFGFDQGQSAGCSIRASVSGSTCT